ncbi:MAG: hypothetical protein U0521_06210 [Anaerolineae bacterium]
MSQSAGTSIRERLTWEVTPENYRQIRRLWISHSKAEDGRDLPGLIATLAEDCVYEIIPTGQRWEGTTARAPSTRPSSARSRTCISTCRTS